MGSPVNPAALRPRRLFAALLMALILATQTRAAGRAQSGIRILDAPAPSYEFGDRITFHISAASSAAITAVSLLVDTGAAAPAVWHSDPFLPANQLTATVTVDLAVNPLPPFASVSYRWQIADRAGQQLTTPAASFVYEDNRFSWQVLSSGSVSVHWYRGDSAFGHEALEVATGALPDITRDVRAPLPDHVNIYIYATDADAQGALGRVGVAYANGHADPKLGVVIVSVPPDLRASYNLQIQVPHEMTHVLIYRAVGANYARVPYWFNEGLAVMHQSQRDSSFPALLAAARDAQQFISLSALCAPFDPAQVSLAYAESESVVRYIRDRFGSEGINRLLTAYAGGADCAAGVQSSLGLSLDQLDLDWRQNLAPPPETVSQRVQTLAPWLLVVVLVLVAPLTFLVVGWRARRPDES